MKSMAVKYVCDMVLYIEGRRQTSEYGMAYIVQNGCREEVRREGQI